MRGNLSTRLATEWNDHFSQLHNYYDWYRHWPLVWRSSDGSNPLPFHLSVSEITIGRLGRGFHQFLQHNSVEYSSSSISCSSGRNTSMQCHTSHCWHSTGRFLYPDRCRSKLRDRIDCDQLLWFECDHSGHFDIIVSWHDQRQFESIEFHHIHQTIDVDADDQSTRLSSDVCYGFR